ncbi:MAG: hypothetical protein H7255_19375 [Ramlibacter sp.]|nr:hypothetical protein [Ramlibacter sp.]
MHNAPPVTYPVGRSRFPGVLSLSLWVLGAVVALLWWIGVDDHGWRGAVIALALCASGVVAGLGWWRTPTAELHWSGDNWSWTEAGKTRDGAVATRLDLQRWMLLAFEAPGASRWLWLERASEPARWDDLRRAVYSRARPQPLPEAPPHAARP